MVAILAWLVRGQRSLLLTRDAVLPLVFLAVATIYSFILPLKANISLLDSVILFALFGAYAFLAAREPAEQPDLVGPAAAIGALAPVRRRLAVVGLFVYAGATIFSSATPFADGLVHTGQKLGIDEFLLVQWVAPLASEAPEFLVSALLAIRGKATAGLGLLLSSKVNQWTLLVGSLPVAYAFGVSSEPGASASVGFLMHALPLDTRQVAEVWLTAAQSLFGIAVLASLSFELGEAALLAGLFLAQFIAGGFLRAALHNTGAADLELIVFAIIYLALSAVFGIQARGAITSTIREFRSAVRPRSTRSSG